MACHLLACRRDPIDGLFVHELLTFIPLGMTLILESWPLEMSSLTALYYYIDRIRIAMNECTTLVCFQNSFTARAS